MPPSFLPSLRLPSRKEGTDSFAVGFTTGGKAEYLLHTRYASLLILIIRCYWHINKPKDDTNPFKIIGEYIFIFIY